MMIRIFLELNSLSLILLLTFSAARQSERHQGSNDAEDLRGQQSVDFSGVGIRLEQLQGLASGDHDLLQLGPGEVPVDGVRDPGGMLQSQVVQMHFRS